MTTSTATIARLIVSVSSLPRSLDFYEGVVGLTRTSLDGDFARLRTGDGIEVMLHQRATQASDTGLSIGLFVDDATALAAEWARRGGQIIDPPAMQPWGELMTVVRDPDGHIVCASTAK